MIGLRWRVPNKKFGNPLIPEQYNDHVENDTGRKYIIMARSVEDLCSVAPVHRYIDAPNQFPIMVL